MCSTCKTAYDACFFFFQAEDGIRDKLVTRVQTCALPISRPPAPGGARQPGPDGGMMRVGILRSEERRVGEEGRSRWSPYHLKNKTREWRDGGRHRPHARSRSARAYACATR